MRTADQLTSGGTSTSQNRQRTGHPRCPRATGTPSGGARIPRLPPRRRATLPTAAGGAASVAANCATPGAPCHQRSAAHTASHQPYSYAPSALSDKDLPESVIALLGAGQGRTPAASRQLLPI